MRLPGIFDFTLVGSVQQMWQSGAYPLSMIVAFMSGIWTYLKLALVGTLFWAPPRVLPAWRRGLWLLWCAALLWWWWW